MTTTSATIKDFADSPLMPGIGMPGRPRKNDAAPTQITGLLLEQEVLNEMAMIGVIDAKGVILYANRLLSETAGYLESELNGSRYQDLFHEDVSRLITRNMLRKMNMGMTWKGEIKCRRKDGIAYWIMCTVVPTGRKTEKFVCIAHDISRQKKMEDMLEEYRARSFRDLYENVQYAGHIHQSLMPDPGSIKNIFQHAFVNYIPKSFVGGDFFWFTQMGKRKVVALGDSTGHGVSASLIASLAVSNLIHLVEDQKGLSPSEILTGLNRHLGHVTNQNAHTVVTESADIAIMDIDTESRVMTYASGKTRILILRNNTIIELKKDNGSVGGAHNESVYNNHTVQLQPLDRIFVFSDGYIDQFGGRFDKRLGSKRLRTMLEKTSVFDMDTQAMLLREYILHWKGQNAQTDDISMIGVEIE